MDSRTQRASGTVVDPRASLAMWLRTGRTQRNLTLEDVAKITKIQPRILEKLETGNLEGLPADVFVKGFVRSFAKCVGLDEREAIERYGAAQSGHATTVAKAFVDSMSVRVVTPQLAAEPTLAAGSLAGMAVASSPEIEVPVIEVVEMAPLASAVVAAPVVVARPVVEIEIMTVAPLAPAVVEAPVEAAPVVVAASVDGEPKKKRSRKKSTTAAPRSRKKKSAVGEAAAVEAVAVEAVAAEAVAVAAEAVAAEAVAAEAVAAEAAADAAAVPAVETSCVDVETPVVYAAGARTNTISSTSGDDTLARDVAMMSVDAEIPLEDVVVDAPALAEGRQRISASSIEVVDLMSDEVLSRDSIDSIETPHETETLDVAAGSWQPTMPPLSTAPSVPWRRPQVLAHSNYVVPHMVIDDADPDSADRDRERRENREHSRLSFLPPILLDREDRSARQGGLTLAVIILLIAATLTLSYLMRRPSARGDGVTLQAGQSELLG